MASYSRQGTGLTGRPKGSPPPRRMTIPFAQKAKLSPPENPALKQAVYPVYELKWEKLKAFLEKRFPGYTFQERRVNNDRYLFEIPEDLTKDDEDAIAKERDKDPKMQARRAQSPE
ncbi:MAG: hypothetical protein L6R35_001829 [Caloplaca aegaea]|nr:MAG: hypothetical protein L6R35_001829 [Caloplaca aegaea]